MTTKRSRQMTLMESFSYCKRKGLVEEEVEGRSSVMEAVTENKCKNDENVCGDVDGNTCESDTDIQGRDLFSENSCKMFTVSNTLDGECESDICAAMENSETSDLEITSLKRLPECAAVLSELKSTSNHSVLFQPALVTEHAPHPYPDHYEDKWDSSHVRMPCSPNSLYPDENQTRRLCSRWKMICQSLTSDIKTPSDLQNAIMKYNRQYIGRWDFSGLHSFFEECVGASYRNTFFTILLPKMVSLALQLPEICTQPIPLLQKQKDHAITLSQKQVSCLLANAFFCTFPRRNSHSRVASSLHASHEYAQYPDINFNRLYCGTKNGITRKNREKLKCLLNYFTRVLSREPCGTITFHRQYLQSFPNWSSSSKSLSDVVISSNGLIEVQGQGMLQVDFANRFVGGGVFGRGCVQEEIRFLICPELIVSRLFTECLGDSESLIITGVEQYNKYLGYGDTFSWNGDFEDTMPRDSWGRRFTQIVAIDALHFNSTVEQFKIPRIKRELDKAFVGFYSCGGTSADVPAVATGNWGCGAFNGYPNLKFLIQLMAASQTGRGMLYLTFGNKTLKEELADMYAFISAKKMTVCNVWMLLEKYCSAVMHIPQKLRPALYDHIYDQLLNSSQSACKEQTSTGKSPEQHLP